MTGSEPIVVVGLARDSLAGIGIGVTRWSVLRDGRGPGTGSEYELDGSLTRSSSRCVLCALHCLRAGYRQGPSLVGKGERGRRGLDGVPEVERHVSVTTEGEPEDNFRENRIQQVSTEDSGRGDLGRPVLWSCHRLCRRLWYLYQDGNVD